MNTSVEITQYTSIDWEQPNLLKHKEVNTFVILIQNLEGNKFKAVILHSVEGQGISYKIGHIYDLDKTNYEVSPNGTTITFNHSE